MWPIIIVSLFAAVISHPTSAGEQRGAEADASSIREVESSDSAASLAASTLDALGSFVELRNSLLNDVKAVNKQIAASQSDAEKQSLKAKLEQHESDLRAITENFENIAAGVDITGLRAGEAEEFNFQRELFALLKPALDEMKEMTAHVRQKSDLKEEIASYEERIPILEKALANAERLIAAGPSKPVTQALKLTAENWKRQRTFMESELQAARLQLDKLVNSEVSLAEASQSYLKSFFQKRGLYLTEALLVIVGIILLSRLSHKAMLRHVPGFRKEHRSFRIRLAELIHRVVTGFLVVVGPMVVFYVVEDWVLFSLSILLLIGIAFTLRQALPRYLHQIQIFLNIGSVREGERLLLDGIPWRVQQINVFCRLVNPVADLVQRVPIDDLVDLKSRPSRPDEPWFPCRKGDWVMLSDGSRGKVAGISPELVQLEEEGGSLLTFSTGDFIGKTPRNLSPSFRIRETLGISYKHQKDSTNKISELLQGYVRKRAEQEGYGDRLIGLRVELELANTSSLDLAVIADFKGELGDSFNRLRRAIQRWCVDACTEYEWEIPFPQMTLHGAVARAD